MRRCTGGVQSGLAKAPPIYWSPNETTGVSARLPQSRQVWRVTKIGENASVDIIKMNQKILA
jgi:hypothetical protein